MDAYHVFRKMRRDGYFSLHAALRAMPSSTNTVRTTKSLDDLTMDTINTDTLTGVVDLDAVEAAAAAYQAARARDEGGASVPVGGELRAIVMQHERVKYSRSVTASAPPPDEPPRKPRAPQVGRSKKKSVGPDTSAEVPAGAAAGAGGAGGGSGSGGGAVVRYNMESGEAMVGGGADMLAVEHMPEIGEFFAPPQPDEESHYVARALKHSVAELDAPAAMDVAMHHAPAAADADMPTAPAPVHSPQAAASAEPKGKGRRLSSRQADTSKRSALTSSDNSPRTTRRSARGASADVRTPRTSYSSRFLHYAERSCLGGGFGRIFTARAESARQVY